MAFLRRKARSGLPNQFPQPGTGFAARSATVDAQFHWAVYPVGVPGFARFTPRLLYSLSFFTPVEAYSSESFPNCAAT